MEIKGFFGLFGFLIVIVGLFLLVSSISHDWTLASFGVVLIIVGGVVIGSSDR